MAGIPGIPHIPNPLQPLVDLIPGQKEEKPPRDPGYLYGEDEVVKYLTGTYGLSKEQAKQIWKKRESDGKASITHLDDGVKEFGDPKVLKTKQAIHLTEQAKNQADAKGDVGTSTGLQAQLDALKAGDDPLQMPKEVGYLTGGRDLSVEEAGKAITEWNRQNANDQIKDLAGLYQRVAYGNPLALAVIGQSLAGEVAGYRVFKFYNAGAGGMVDVKVENTIWDGLAKANPQLVAHLPTVLGESQRTGGMVPPAILASAVRVMGLDAADRVNSGGTDLEQVLKAIDGISSGAAFHPNPNASIQMAGTAMRAALGKYNDYGLALVSLRDPDLADQLYEQGGASPDQALKVNQIFIDAGYNPQAMAQQGVAIDPNKFAAATGSDGGSGSAGNVQVTLPDPAKLAEGVTDLWRSWFQRDPTGGEIETYSGQIASLITGRANEARARTKGNVFKGIIPGQEAVTVEDVDPQSRLIEAARMNPDYQQLFRNMPGGVAEDQYANQFKAAGAQLMGQLPDATGTRVGMETGNVQSTIGYLAGTQQAKDSSTFQERMAQQAQRIAKFT